jgi:Phytanoyl-CoA dioxygenase (PhyH)
MAALKNIISDPKLAHYYAQKAVRSLPLRRLAGDVVAKLIGKPKTIEMNDQTRAVVQKLSDDGLCFLPTLHLSGDDLALIFKHLAGKPVIDLYDGETSFLVEKEIPAPYSKLSYKAEDILSCAPLLRLANAPLILNAVSQILGARPSIAAYQAWWTLGENNTSGSHVHHDDVYHRDVDDWRFIKLFVYLTDTNERSGAHNFVLKSHTNAHFTRRGAISDEDVNNTFPASDVRTITGSAGTVFLENTWGIHRPLLATEGRRLIFSVLYSMCPWVPGRPKVPLMALPQGLDPYVNRIFCQS